jgi:Tfp pilus assembly protein PilP
MIKRIGIGALLATMVFMTAAPALAQEEAAAVAEEKTTIEKRVYEYSMRGRRDPFVSLITPLTAEEDITGNPLWDNDVSQMRVVAIIHDDEKSYALFALPDGKYYTITEGMEIGLHGGHVETISEDAVLIREQKPDFKGKMRPVDTYLRLRKEEGQ